LTIYWAAGFCAGLLVSVFSKTLVLLAGIGMVIIQVRLISSPLISPLLLYPRACPLQQQKPINPSIYLVSYPRSPMQADNLVLHSPPHQVAARNGIDLVSNLKLKERMRSSRILAALNQHTAFKLSFALAFALSAFMSF
jgi:hypothetical protein